MPLPDFLTRPLSDTDPQAAEIVRREEHRQQNTLELIASENHVSVAVRQAAGSVFTNKYAEGYPGKRYYGGCVNMDSVEELARQRAKELFKAEHANVQTHSGAQANLAVYLACVKPGDTVLGLDLSHGGHLTHGMKINFSGALFNVVAYGVRRDTEQIDMDEVRRLAREHRPKLIVAGFSAYPRKLDFAAFGEIAREVGARLMCDVAHVAGLIVAGLYPDPVPHSDFVTTTTHKTLRGPRGGLILCREADAKLIDRWVFPGVQGGPLMHIIAAKAVAFGEALRPEFRTYQQRIVENARALAEALLARGYRLVSGGTDNHLMLVDLRPAHPEVSGKDAEEWLESAGIIVNKNMIPFDDRKPAYTSGLRLGTPALTTRGLGPAEMQQVAELLHRVLSSKADPATITKVREDVLALCARFPLPH
ncbi:MAG: serine hydroxymethyltransferase [Planctomycetes bacterium]|nr:serine hydroxymethyltransferase [Planctomycetota bacterium]